MEGIVDKVRLATPEEIKEIEEHADITPGAQVLRFGPAWAVMRNVVEVDPMICDNPRRRALFVMNLESHMRLLGVPAYYFNVDAADTTYQNVAENWGAIRTSATAEYRYKVPL